MPLKTLVCIGDSIVEGEGDDARRDGWVGRLRERLAHNSGVGGDGWRVFNLGIGGDTIRDIELRLGEALCRQPDAVILGNCTNDVVEYREGEAWHPKVPAYVRQRAWARVLQKLKGVTDKVLVTPGVNAEADLLSPDYRLMRAAFQDHAAFIKDLAVKAGADCVEIPPGLSRPDLRSHTLHWNGAGYDAVAEIIFAKVKQLEWV